MKRPARSRLGALQSSRPASGAAHLWYQSGRWIRGVFPVDVRGTDPSGVCRMLVSWDGHVIQDSGERPTNGGFWDQCDPNHVPNSPQDFFVSATLDTRTTVPTSARGVQLTLQAHNASYNPASGAPDWSSDVEYLNVDNQPVGLSLTGPTQASVAGGTQHVDGRLVDGALPGVHHAPGEQPDVVPGGHQRGLAQRQSGQVLLLLPRLV